MRPSGISRIGIVHRSPIFLLEVSQIVVSETIE